MSAQGIKALRGRLLHEMMQHATGEAVWIQQAVVAATATALSLVLFGGDLQKEEAVRESAIKVWTYGHTNEEDCRFDLEDDLPRQWARKVIPQDWKTFC